MPATFDLSAYAGKTVDLRFRYVTDGAAGRQRGFFADDDHADPRTATAGFTDGAETGANGWTLDGFSAVGRHDRPRRTTTTTSPRNRDVRRRTTSTCKTGPYNFGFASTKPDYVEHFPYQDGLLDLLLGHLAGDNNTQPAPRLRV